MVKRIYKLVTVAPATGGYAVLLDAKPVRSGGKQPLTLPGIAMAEAIAAEWSAQGGDVDPGTMPLTRLANTAIDTVADRHEAVVDEIVNYAETDLVCYRVTGPEVLYARQAEIWDPLVAWIGETHGAEMVVTTGLLPVAQPVAARASIRKSVMLFDAFSLTALHTATGALGSVIIALAMADRLITAMQACEASLIEETYQSEKWGEDAEAEARRTNLAADLAAANYFLDLCR